ncbi:uncharacterized protein J4E88_008628 [Alternaria novae-zelandiae]|uniref:uncharacterized protein n=1 Tax=Alternaria novae-zelandiae TaxID=430562 RepID=UPI0020C5AB99|nr:uncharacterized protein J4E88_008628 [Alternaria novae-zelandiae]KAI4673573.1 hypothetical protein J4E88_008628 [Alternaria novae-zelandiae]
MNNLPSSPAYYLGPISCPVLPAHRMDGLKEREPSRAGDLYTAEIGQTVNTINHQRNAVKLIMARWSTVDPVHYPTILGVSQNDSKSEDVKAVVSMVNTMQTSWIGQSSWVQGYIKGETTRERRPPSLAAPIAAERIRKRSELTWAQPLRSGTGARRRRTSPEHRKSEVGDTADSLGELQAIRDQIESLQEYQGGPTATNDGPFRNFAEVPAAEPYYAQMASKDKCAFWEAR